jgi:hypothetical protein
MGQIFSNFKNKKNQILNTNLYFYIKQSERPTCIKLMHKRYTFTWLFLGGDRDWTQGPKCAEHFLHTEQHLQSLADILHFEPDVLCPRKRIIAILRLAILCLVVMAEFRETLDTGPRAKDLETRNPGSVSWLCHLLMLWFGVIIMLTLNFLIYKRRIQKLSSKNCCLRCKVSSIRLGSLFIVVLLVLLTFAANLRIIKDERRKSQGLLEFQNNHGFLNSLASSWRKNICFCMMDLRCHGNKSWKDFK